MKTRSPWIAGILNVFWGLGYLYGGRKKLLGVSLLTLIWAFLTLEMASRTSGFSAVAREGLGEVKAKGINEKATWPTKEKGRTKGSRFSHISYNLVLFSLYVRETREGAGKLPVFQKKSLFFVP